MILTVIIVNYNVKYLLEKCLCSVLAASRSIPSEIFVVDNASSDGSMQYLLPKFESVQFINNVENVGFSRANNQALLLASGKYILFLNPDTLIPETSLGKCILFMESHSEAGALGVRMVDGDGKFLRESKRGFPSPSVSFWKMTGITSMAKRSRHFARYYLGHLPENEIHEVDVLSGAYMLVRKDVLKITGGFDERFFMYAEDIDLSYRITKAGFKNYYYPEVTIVHYKGESTKKDFKYVKQFYKSMSQFVKKYYGCGPYSYLLDAGIFLRAMVHMILRGGKKKNVSRGDPS